MTSKAQISNFGRPKTRLFWCTITLCSKVNIDNRPCEPGSTHVEQGHPPFSFVKNILYLWPVCQSLTPLEARSLHKYQQFRESSIWKVQSYWAVWRGKEAQRSWTEDWRCLDYTKGWRWWLWSLIWLWWGRRLWWGRSLSAASPALRRSWTPAPPSRQTASRCWGSPAVAAAWPVLCRGEHPAGSTQPTALRVSAANPGPERPGRCMLWPEDKGSALRI